MTLSFFYQRMILSLVNYLLSFFCKLRQVLRTSSIFSRFFSFCHLLWSLKNPVTKRPKQPSHKRPRSYALGKSMTGEVHPARWDLHTTFAIYWQKTLNRNNICHPLKLVIFFETLMFCSPDFGFAMSSKLNSGLWDTLRDVGEGELSS